MIGIIIRKELIEIRRDGRAIGLLGIVGLLLLLGLMAGFATENARRQSVQQAQANDAAVFLEQGIKNPHAAAHFSRMAHKPVAPLAAFDPGVASYLGQVIWLEAHYRNPAMFRSAEDAPELSRLENFSVAGVLTLVLPLLVILVGYGSIASERERGTLRLLLGSGASLQQLLQGKFLVIAGVAIAVLLVAVLVATLFSVQTLSGAEYSLIDLLLRGISLLLGYGLYIICLTAITLLVSTLVASARTALLVLLGVWAISVVGMPRWSASIAEHVYPSPDAVAFWQEARARLDANSPTPGSEDYTMLERQVIERALGRELQEGELDAIAINRGGLMLEVSELSGAQAYRASFEGLFANYDRQRSLRRILSLLSPTIALQHLSRAFAGTDVSAHEHFSLAAEQQRNNIVRVLNEDMILNGAGQSFGYLAPAELWQTVPAFEYSPAAVTHAWSECMIDLLVLALWGAVATAALFRLGSNRLMLR